MPVMSSSAPELEGAWQEVKRSRREKDKTKPKTPAQVCSYLRTHHIFSSSTRIVGTVNKKHFREFFYRNVDTFVKTLLQTPTNPDDKEELDFMFDEELEDAPLDVCGRKNTFTDW